MNRANTKHLNKMKEYKNIDRIFQEKFRDFEQEPSAKVWKNIEQAMAVKPKRGKRAVWLWLSGVAAGLAILFFMNSPFLSSSPQPQNTTDTEEITPTTVPSIQNDIVTIPIENRVVKKQEKARNNTVNPIKLVKSTKKEIVIAETEIVQSKSKPTATTTTQKISSESKPIETKVSTHIAAISPAIIKEVASPTTKVPDETVSTTTISVAQNESLTDKMIVKNSKEKEQKSTTKKWVVSTLAAPVFLSAFDKNTSSIDSRFNKNNKGGNFSSAYGVQVAYQINNRFSLQSGVHLVDYGYKTRNIYISPSGAVSRYSNINYNANAGLINVSAVPVENPDLSDETRLEGSKGDLTQVFGYVEVPFEVKYKLNQNKKIGVNLIGGFSTLLLNKNEIYIEAGEFSNKLGEASNLNSLNFSGNFGVEFEYNIYKNVNFNLVPMFKVHTHTFQKNTGGFSPYAIGVYSGLNLRF